MLAIFRVYIDDYSDFTVLVDAEEITKKLQSDSYNVCKHLQKHIQSFFGKEAKVNKYEYKKEIEYDEEIPYYLHFIQVELNIPNFVHSITLTRVLQTFGLDSELQLCYHKW